VFEVGATGEVSTEFVFDGGFYEGELGIFKTEGMSAFLYDTTAFAKEAARRVLTNSSWGYVAIYDPTEGAKFSGILGAEPRDWNKGTYQGFKTFSMNPGYEFGLILAPRNRMEDVFNNPALLTGTRDPLFSIATADPKDAFNSGQIADVTGLGAVFAIEDMPVNAGADKDYNDVMFLVTGATGTAALLDKAIKPELDWRGTVLGRNILDYIKSATDTDPPAIAAGLVNDTGEESGDGITQDTAIAGRVTDRSRIASLRAGFDSTPLENFTDVTAYLNGDGSFSFFRALLEGIIGNRLSDGAHALHLQASDENGNVSSVFDVHFTLDTAAPALSLTAPIAGWAHSPTARLIGSASDTGGGARY